MELQDPVAVYTAASNLQAHEIAELLLASSIPSQVVEDNAPQGMWMGGWNSSINKPQVWVSTHDVEQAVAIIQGFEARALDRRLSHQVQVDLQSEWIDARCDKCGTVTRYAPIEKGTVVNCPNCFAFMDVGGDVDFDDWNVIEHEGDEVEPSDEEEAPE